MVQYHHNKAGGNHTTKNRELVSMEDKSFAYFGALVVVRRVQEFNETWTSFYGYCPRPGEYGWTSDLQSAKFFTDILTAEDEARSFMNELCNETRQYLNVEVAKLAVMNL